jgi:ankyrin repeat protein
MEQANRNHELWAVMQGGHNARVAELLAAGLAPSVPDSHGQTPLYWAAGKGHTATTALLVQHGANVHARDTAGRTALDGVPERGHSPGLEWDDRDLVSHTPLVVR